MVILTYGVLRVDWAAAARKAQEAAEAEGIDDELEEKRELLAYENEALVGRTPESFRMPSTLTPSTPSHTPSRRMARAKERGLDQSPELHQRRPYTPQP